MKSPQSIPLVLGFVSCAFACTENEPPSPPVRQTAAPVADPVDRAALLERAKSLFGSIEPENTTDDPEVEAARVALGKALYYEERLSKNHDLSCNSCHDLEHYGVDVREQDGKRTPTSRGHRGVFGERNSPTTYNAFVHVAQFWDGRAEDVEAQAKGPVLNPVEMAMPGAKRAVEVLRSIPGYRPMFAAAFPEQKKPITWDNFATAVGAFERKLVTPAPVDRFLAGDVDVLTEQQARGFELFTERCVACHMGPGFGGAIYQKLGLLKAYPTEDRGRVAVTGNADDERVFKVPSLRNVAMTAPYLHDGSVETLPEMVAIMSEYQTPQGKLTEAQIEDVVAFLEALTGDIHEKLIARPELPDDGPRTPAPDPS